VPVVCKAILLLLGLGGIGAEVLALLKLRHYPYNIWGVVAVFVAPLLLGIAFVHMASRLPAHRVQRLLLEFVLLGLSIPVIEAGLTEFAWTSPSAQMQRFATADKLHIPFDHRYKSQVVEAMRSDGINAYPGMPRDLLWQSDIKQRVGSSFYPLAQVASSSIVDCNETGSYLVYRTDEYGFNNPAGIYDSGRIDIAAVGSSFTLGYCVPPGHAFMALLQQRYPRTLNFGIAGSHVPTMYATFREYVEPLHPPLVLWVLYPNAIEYYELDDPIIHRYVNDPEFSQHLVDRRAEVDQFMRDKVTPIQWELDRRSAKVIAEADERRWRDIPRLPLLRDKVVPLVKGTLERPPPLNDFAPSIQIIGEVKRRVEGWGGHLVIVIIPVFDELISKQYSPSQSSVHIIDLLKPLNVHIINGVTCFRQQRDPTMLYTMGMSNHFNENGHRLFADYVDADLRATYPQIMATAAE
jgi:hypothetical protein